jgi:hypothetical protein
MNAAAIDAEYYEAVAKQSLAERLLVAARKRIYRDFVSCCQPTPKSTILDVGVSDIVNDGANLIERQYPYPEQIAAVGLGNGVAFKEAFPKVRYAQIEPNARLPFADGQFDIATCNAVIEHVGGLEQQSAFVAELRRVARLVFISAPNRYFPIEHHTGVPFLHIHPASFALACRLLRKTAWLDPANLILMDRRSLAALAPDGRTGMTGLPLGPFSSNLYLLVGAQCK